MIGKSPFQNQKDLFQPMLIEFIDMSHELVLLANKIDWGYFEKSFSKYNSHTGQPSMPILFIVGCLILMRIYNLGDETLAQAWIMNPYMQYFCGESHFRHKFPCDPSDFVHFRKRIGEEGIEHIFTHSVELHGKQVKSKMVLSDTTVQENNVTFPTDLKLAKKIIDKCHKIAVKEHIEQRQSYKRVSKNFASATYNSNHPRRRKNALRAQRKLKTIADKVVRKLCQKLPEDILPSYVPELMIYQRSKTEKARQE